MWGRSGGIPRNLAGAEGEKYSDAPFSRTEVRAVSERRPSTRKFKIAFAGILLVLVLILVIQNQEPVSTEVLLWSFDVPRFALLASVFLVGIVVGYLFGRTTRIELRKK